MSEQVCIPLETARLIDKVFLPVNPNKLRVAHPDVKAAVVSFKAFLAEPAPEAQPEPQPAYRVKYLLQAEYASMLRKAQCAANPGPEDRDWDHMTKIERQAYKAALEIERLLSSHQQCVDALREAEIGLVNSKPIGWVPGQTFVGRTRFNPLSAIREALAEAGKLEPR